MNQDKYFIITSSEDGTTVEQITKEELMSRITPDEDGDLYYGLGAKFLNELPEWNDGYPNMSFEDVIIIKGDFVVPKEKKVVTQYEL